jgi:hypothetical protein
MKRAREEGSIAPEGIEVPNARQHAFISRVKEGKNAFVSGGAGTGKTFTIMRAQDELEGVGVTVIKLAHQGVSAINLGGFTINRFMGIGLGRDSLETYEASWRRRMKGKAKDPHVLLAATAGTVFIDEISQVTSKQLQLLEMFFRLARSPTQGGDAGAWGGIQVIAVGDFCQTLPVERDDEYLFDTELFKQAFPSESITILTEIMRQKDAVEHGILERCRFGRPTHQDMEYFENMVGKELPDIGVPPITLVPVNSIAKSINDKAFNDNSNPVDVFSSSYDFSLTPAAGVRARFRHAMETVKDVSRCELPEFVDEAEAAAIRSTIMDRVVMFELTPPCERLQSMKPGMAVMVTRNMSTPVTLYNGMRGVYVGKSDSGGPLVRMEGSEEPIVIPRTQWTRECTVKTGRGTSATLAVSFVQVPLQAAAAISIHKSLGLTLSQVILDIGDRIFCNGQAYVGVSRCANMGTSLSLMQFSRACFFADRTCVEFYMRAIRAIDAGDEARRQAGLYVAKRMRVGLKRYGHGMRREDDTREYGTGVDSWVEMAMEEIADCMVYIATDQLRKDGAPRPVEEEDDNSLIVRMVEDGKHPLVQKLSAFWNYLNKSIPSPSAGAPHPE